MALGWKPGEGYDIHVLRGGPPSKSLANAVTLPPNTNASTLKFTPEFAGAPNNLRVSVKTATGEVTASLPPPNTSQIEIHNFLIRASAIDTAGQTHDTVIRVHVHDKVQDIWLTPATLTIHKGSDNCRFTVLAAFTDGTMGDITEWPGLTYEAHALATTTPSPDVKVATDGVLTTVNVDRMADVKVTWTEELPVVGLTSLKSAPSRVMTRTDWVTTAGNASVTFVVAGLRLDPDDPKKSATVVPNKTDPNSSKRDSVASVLANATNVVIISEGFRRESDFMKLVNRIVEDQRTQDHLEPFKLLQDSVNYWAVFVPSQDDGITILSEFTINEQVKVASPTVKPRRPTSVTDPWSLEEIVHEVGLPVHSDSDTLAGIKGLWQTRYGNKNYDTQAAKIFSGWRDLARPGISRLATLNERDTAFGMRNMDRQRASPGFGVVMLGNDPRRTTDADIFKFVANLRYGTHNIGSNWISGKDKDLICFLCNCERHAGNAWGYFLASTGRGWAPRIKVNSTPRGAVSVDIDVPPLTTREELDLSTVVTHELCHKFGLADEYGDGGGTFSDADRDQPNIMAKKDIVTTVTMPNVPARTLYAKTEEIKWRWPRVLKAGVVIGFPQASGKRLTVKLRMGHGKAFAFNDIVRFRLRPVTLAPSKDVVFNFAIAQGHHLFVRGSSDDEVVLALGQPGGTELDFDVPNPGNPDPRSWKDILLALFKPGAQYTLVCARRRGLDITPGGIQVNLMAENIRGHIIATHAPLNAKAGSPGATHETHACGPSHSSVMTPTNLPSLATKPANLSDIIGIYDGGGIADCGVFHPAGRCKMRQSNDHAGVFCHVCRYYLVDRIDPTKHGALDKMYPESGP